MDEGKRSVGYRVSGTPEYHVASRRMRKFLYGRILCDRRAELFLNVSLDCYYIVCSAEIVGSRVVKIESRCLAFHWGIEYRRSVEVVVRRFMEWKEAEIDK